MIKRALIAAGLAMVAATAHATENNTPSKQPVEVDCSNGSGDTVGSKVCMELRDRIAASPRYYLKDSGFRWALRIVTISETDGVNTAISYAITMNSGDDAELYATNGVELCGSNRVATCATDILSGFDTQVASVMKAAATETAKK